MVGKPWLTLLGVAGVCCLSVFVAWGQAAELREDAWDAATRQGFQEHCPKGAPGRSGVLVRQGYVLGFDAQRRIPTWVAYHVKPEYLLEAEEYESREPVDDPVVREARSAQELQDLGEDYVPVRLAPIEIMGGDRTGAVDEACYTGNVVAMHRALAAEKGLWRQLQLWVCQGLVRERRLEAWVVCGCVAGPPGPTAATQIPMFFQIVVVPSRSGGDWEFIAFLIPHQREQRGRPEDFIVPIEVVENATGLKFFPELEAESATRIKRQEAGQTWHLSLPSEQPPKAVRGVIPPVPGGIKSMPLDVPSAKPTQQTLVRVFYGTDRARNRTASGPNEFYSPSRGRLEYGVCEVSLPPGHQLGEVERPAWWKLELSENPLRHVVLQQILPAADPEKFFAELKQNVAGRDTFIFVHGYNNSFAVAARRTAQLAVDLELRYAPLMYSWPSHDSVEGYPLDELEVDQSLENFRTYLRAVAAQSGARRIHLIAHSMGTRLLAGALRDLKLKAGEKPPEFNEVILAAPDITAEDFRKEIAPRINGVGSRITVYTSQRDKALIASRLFHEWGGQVTDATRLGAGLIDLTKYNRIEQIDATRVDTSILGHAYYGEESPLLKDIGRVLEGVRPPQRALVATRFGYLIPDPLDIPPSRWGPVTWVLAALAVGGAAGFYWRRRKQELAPGRIPGP